MHQTEEELERQVETKTEEKRGLTVKLREFYKQWGNYNIQFNEGKMEKFEEMCGISRNDLL